MQAEQEPAGRTEYSASSIIVFVRPTGLDRRIRLAGWLEQKRRTDSGQDDDWMDRSMDGTTLFLGSHSQWISHRTNELPNQRGNKDNFSN